MWNHTLHLRDVFEIVILCALLFIPLGMFLKTHMELIVRVLRPVKLSRTNLKDKGSFVSFMKIKDKDTHNEN
jgi:hypothetical protein